MGWCCFGPQAKRPASLLESFCWVCLGCCHTCRRAVPLLWSAQRRERAQRACFTLNAEIRLYLPARRATRDPGHRRPFSQFSFHDQPAGPRSRKCHPYKPYIKRRYGVCRVYPRRPLPIPMAPPAAPVEPPAWPRPLWAGRRSARPLGAPPARVPPASSARGDAQGPLARGRSPGRTALALSPRRSALDFRIVKEMWYNSWMVPESRLRMRPTKPQRQRLTEPARVLRVVCVPAVGAVRVNENC